MAFTGLTPESLLERSDSKNPATTCKGITKLGRPCRNPLSIDPAKAAQYNGVLAVVSVASDDSDEEEIGAAAFFCHKHKDQAEKLVLANADGHAPQSSRRDTRIYPLQNRSSIDTLVARLGVLDVEENAGDGRREKRREGGPGNRRASGQHKPTRRVNRPPTWDRVHGPLMEVPSDVMKQRPPAQGRPQQRKKSSFWACFGCGVADDDYVEVVRHKKRVSAPQSQPTSMSQNHRQSSSTHTPPNRPIPPQPSSRPPHTTPTRKPLTSQPANPPSPTSTLLSYIPKSLTPQTTSLLLAELSKPISPHDEEGYIYIFWLTQTSAGPAPSSTASTLLTPPSRPEQGRRTSDILRQYSVRQPQRPNPGSRPRRRSAVGGTSDGRGDADGGEEKNTILLKIGRANNVHRRMNEWSRQCGYSLSLVRFYPYIPSTPSPSPSPHPRRHSVQNVNSQNANSARRPSDHARRASASSANVRKVPHAHRVERLIHIELAGQRVVRSCETCGKEHREWFEVEASREGVKGVDEVVRRWVGWAERVGVS